MKFTLFIEGTPKPAGSKRGFAIKKGGHYTGKVAQVDMSGEAGRAWRSDVKDAARAAFHEPPLEKPLAVMATFYQARPKCHYGSGKNAHILKATAPKYPVTKPDATKLFRSVEDALTGILWKDDCQIVAQQVRKKYCDADHPRPGVWIRMEIWE